jgi:superoxide reductase
MSGFKDVMQSADWKSEKHVPAIVAPDSVKAGEYFNVEVNVGKEVAHPNTTEHHIRWIILYFQPEGVKAPFQVGRYEFDAHGESAKGANQGPVYTNSCVITSMKTDKPGTLLAASYCNIHGLWESSKEIKVS